MKPINLATFSLCLILASATCAAGKEWRGIPPLHSTRADVERLLGPALEKDFDRYELPDEIVYVGYAQFPCDYKSPAGWPTPPPGYNVPKDIVEAIRVYLRHPVPLSSLGLDLKGFERVRGDDDQPQHFYHMNWGEGFGVEFFDYGGDRGETVTGYIYQASAKDEALFRCKAAQK